MSGSRAGWRRVRTDARLARRQVWRTKGSSALVMLLIVLPVAALAGGGIFWQSHIPTAEQTAALELGRHQSWLQIVGGLDPTRWQSVDQPYEYGVESDDTGKPVNVEGPRPDDPSEYVPADAELRTITEWGSLYVETETGIGQVSATAGDVWDEVFEGRYVVLDGAAPATAGEAMASPGLLERMGAEIGDDVVLVDSGRAFTVTGTLRRADARPEDPEVFLPSQAADLVEGQERWFAENWQPDLDQLAELNRAGFIVYAHDLAVDPPPGAKIATYRNDSSQDVAMLMTGLLLAVFSGYLVVLLAGAAFAVAARRQQQTLAVAASVGAARSDVFRIVVMQGTVLGALSGAIGIALGAALAWAGLEITDTGAVNSFWGNWGYRVPWVALVGVALFAIVVGTLSAVAPARAATKGDVLGALRGSRRPAVLLRRRPCWGLGLMITGLAATAGGGLTLIALNTADPVDYSHPLRVAAMMAVALGPVVFQIGFLVAGHWVLVRVGLPLAKIGLAPRLASRDSAANPSRVVPAFAAIAACVFIASYATATTALTAAGNARTYWFNGPLHSVSVSLFQNGSDPSPEPLEAAEELLGSTAPVGTALVLAPTSAAFDPLTGEALDPDHPVYALQSQSWRGCETCTADPSSAMNGQLSIVPAGDVALLLDHPVDDATLDAYRDGAAITTTTEYTTPEDEVVVTEWTEQGRTDFYDAMNAVDWESDPDERFAHVPAPLAERSIDAVYVDTGSNHSTQVLLAPETAESLGIEYAPAQLVGVYDEPLSEAAIDRLTAEASGVRLDDGASLWVMTERGPDPVAPWLWMIVAIAGVLVIGASAVVLGLARFERRPDDATLTAVGGSRVLRRNVNAWQAAIIVGIGAVVGTIAGLIPVWGTAQSSTDFLRLSDLPWPWLAILGVGLPLAITVVAWLVPPRHPELTRRTAIA